MGSIGFERFGIQAVQLLYFFGGLGFGSLRITETVEAKPYTSGRYYLGIANHFIRFPRMAAEKQESLEGLP